MALQPGAQFGRYELVSRVGSGGMAETYRAQLLGEAGVTKPVLIKKVLSEYANDEAFTTMFISEARISATLSHGNIAQVYDFGRVNEEYFLAMEYVDGQPLHRIIKRALQAGMFSIPISIATFIGMEMSRGLHYAHTRTDHGGKPLGIVHRDISPDNVLVSYEGQVKIVDFGIAKARDLRGFNTEPGVVKGKFLFFSPEQARGEEVDARTDVWATGIVLYEMLCGKLPVQGPGYAALPKLIRGDFPRPRQLNPEVPRELEDIVMQALAVDREQRFPSSHELGDALAGFLYSTEPRFSALWLSLLVKTLFQEDLAAEGRQVQVPHSFLEQLRRWQGSSASAASVPRTTPPTIPPPTAAPPRPVTAHEEDSISSVTTSVRSPPAPREPTAPVAKPASSSMSGRELGYLILGAGGALVVFILVFVFVFFTREESPPVQLTPGAAAPSQSPNSQASPGGSPPAPLPSPPPSQAPRTRSNLEDAAKLFEAKQYADAAALAQSCLKDNPKDADCLKLAGDAYAELGRKAEATELYLAFLREAPQDPRAAEVGLSLRRLSTMPPRPPPNQAAAQQAKAAFDEAAQLIRAKQYSRALPLATRCVELTPSNAECEMILGACHAGMSRFDEAAKHYRRFLELAPDHRLAPMVRRSLEAYEKR